MSKCYGVGNWLCKVSVILEAILEVKYIYIFARIRFNEILYITRLFGSQFCLAIARFYCIMSSSRSFSDIVIMSQVKPSPLVDWRICKRICIVPGELGHVRSFPFLEFLWVAFHYLFLSGTLVNNNNICHGADCHQLAAMAASYTLHVTLLVQARDHVVDSHSLPCFVDSFFLQTWCSRWIAT